MSTDKWGQCILSVVSKKSVLRKCDEKFRYRTIQIMKQTMISSMMYCDSNGRLLTQELINKITSIKSNVLQMLKENRIKFDNDETILLYDGKYNQDIYRIEIKTPPQVKEHALQFWLNNTRIDPSPTNTIIPDHSNKDQTGNKIRSVIRWLKYTLDDFYELWEKKGGGKALCDQLGCKFPSKTSFINLRPKQIRFERLNDLAVCTKHYNYQQMVIVLLDLFKHNHLCGTKYCRYYQHNPEEICKCNHCKRCPILKKCFTGNPDELIHKIYCANNKQWPNLKCIDGDCRNRECGINLLKGILNNNLCPTFFIRHDLMVEFDEIIEIEQDDKRKHHQLVTVTKTWDDFIEYFTTKILVTFLSHSTQHQSGHCLRSKLTKNSEQRPNKLNLWSPFSSWDYGGAIVVKSSVGAGRSASAQGDNMAVRFLEIYGVIKALDGNLIKLSTSYFSDSKHAGWQMALEAAKHYIPFIKQKNYELNSNICKMLICYSDCASKDFRCQSFFAFLGNIAKNNSSMILWCFTAPEEGKYLHDQEIGLQKQAELQCVKDKSIKWNDFDTYSAAIVSALTNKFKDEKYKKVKRYFFEIPAATISTLPSPHKSYKGITKHFSFLMGYKINHMWAKRFIGTCDYCCKGDWNNCICSYFCGPWKPHQFKDLPYPSRNQIQPNDNTNNSNNNRNHNRIMSPQLQSINSGYGAHIRINRALNAASPYTQ
eukprot:533974_1